MFFLRLCDYTKTHIIDLLSQKKSIIGSKRDNKNLECLLKAYVEKGLERCGKVYSVYMCMGGWGVLTIVGVIMLLYSKKVL